MILKKMFGWMKQNMNKWVIQETKSKKIIEVIDGTIDEAFAKLKYCGDNGKGFSLTTAPMFDNYEGISFHE